MHYSSIFLKRNCQPCPKNFESLDKLIAMLMSFISKKLYNYLGLDLIDNIIIKFIRISLLKLKIL